MVGSFAVVTMLTKNAFLDEIRKQYVPHGGRRRGCRSDACCGTRVPQRIVAADRGFPAAFIGAFFTGSLLIETLFSLDGLGLLSYESVVRA